MKNRKKNNPTPCPWGPDNPHPLSRMKTELVWEGKYDEYGNRRPLKLPASPLPLQRLETIDAPRDTKKAEAKRQGLLFAEEEFQRQAHRDDFRNMLIWGDNKLVMAALLEQFRGKVDLIYIDPPFDVGADFSMQVALGNEEEALQKEQSILEAVAYRDTWGRGTDSYLHMMYERLMIMRDMLSEKGSLFVHFGPNIAHYFRPILDEIFGSQRFRNDIIWKRTDAHNDPKQCGIIHDMIFFYTKSTFDWTWNPEDALQPLPESTIKNWYFNKEVSPKDIVNRLGQKISKGTIRYFNKADITGAGSNPNDKPFRGVMPPAGRHWAYKPEVMEQLDKEGRIYYSKSGKPYEKRYLDESRGIPPQSVWLDISMLRGLSKKSSTSEWYDYNTQKPERLIERGSSLFCVDS